MEIVANGNKFQSEDYTMYDLNWKKLYFGTVPVKDMRLYTPELEWQKVRVSMKGTTNLVKFRSLCQWLVQNNFSYSSRIQVTNYVTALSRGGLIVPEDYR